MKRINFTALLLSFIMLICCTACSSTESVNPGNDGVTADEQMELIVFAAASLTETLTELGEMYMQENENIRLVFNFDSSGTLKTQIQEGAECDIFISAGQQQMNELDVAADDGGLDMVLDGTRFDILENKIALVVPDGNPAGINTYAELVDALNAARIMLAIGNSDVPAGQYTLKIFEYFGLNEAELANAGSITYGSNVKEIATQISESVVDCGIIYQTDAFSAGLTVVDTASAEMCGQVIYPAAVMKNSDTVNEAKAFLDYIMSDTADEVFSRVGFTPAE